MTSSVLWFVARRHLAGGRSTVLLSLISWITLAGVTLGVSSLVVVTAVMTGMQQDLRTKLLEAAPHVLVRQLGTSLRLEDWPMVTDSAMANESVVGAAPFVLSEVTMIRRGERGNYSQSASLFGVSPEEIRGAATGIEEDILDGIHDLAPPESGLPPLLLGLGVADRMQLFPGDTVIVASWENLRTDLMVFLRPTMKQFEVTGTFSTGMYDYDIGYVYTTIDDARELIGISDSTSASGVGVKVADPALAAGVAVELAERLPFDYVVQSWEQTNRALFSALKLEKIAMGVILFLIVLVAAFNIVSTLVMVVADRRREIGILRAMGMRGIDVTRIFVIQGLGIGITGTALGAALGVSVSLLIERFELIRIPPEVYFVDHLPVSIQAGDLAWIVGASVAVSILATIYPATQAARMAPVDAIRHD